MALTDAPIFMEAPRGIVTLAESERTIDPPSANWPGNKVAPVRFFKGMKVANVATTIIDTGKIWNTYFVGNSPQALGVLQLNPVGAVPTDDLLRLSGSPRQPPAVAEIALETSLEVQQLRREFQALALEVRKIASGEHRVTISEVAAPIPRGYRSKTLDEMKAELGAAIAGDAWLDLLHYVADAETTIEPVVLEAARYGLGSDDPAVRSASGRVLVASGDEKLTTQVREVLEDEPNALVAHTLRSALRGATA